MISWTFMFPFISSPRKCVYSNKERNWRIAEWYFFYFSQRHIVRSNKNGSEDLSKTGSSSSLSSLLFPCGFAPRPASGQLLRGKKPCSKLFSCTFLQFLYQCRAGAGFCVPHTRCCTPPGQGRKLPLLKVFRFIWCSVFCLFCHCPASKFLVVTSEKKM